MWHVFLSSTGKCFPPVSLSWLAIICFQSLPIPLFLYLTKTKPTNLKAFPSYLLLTAMVLKEVKQMMFLILHFQRISAKPCCSLGPTNQGNPGSLLTSWLHGSTLSWPWTVVSSLLTQPKDPKSLSLRGLGCAPTDPWLQHRACQSFKSDTVSVSWPTSHLPPATSAADTEVSCPATPLLPSTKTTVPLKIHLMLSLPQTCKPTMTMHLQKPSDWATQHTYQAVLPQSISWRTETQWSPCDGHRGPLFCTARRGERYWKLRTPDMCGAAELSAQGTSLAPSLSALPLTLSRNKHNQNTYSILGN